MAGNASRKPWVLVPLVLVFVGACAVVVVLVRGHADTYEPPPLAFDGSSDTLEKTVIVPTLDTPMPEGKNVIWCASFQLAWNEFRDDVIGEPVRITGAQAIADSLNSSTITGAVLEPGSYYAKAGYVRDGAVERIQRDMAAQFPDVPTPGFDVEDPDLVAVMYAYLAANVEFTKPFYPSDRGLSFGGVTVSAFGIPRGKYDVPHALLGQIDILYYSGDPYGSASDEDEFAIDPCKDTEPYQIVLARITPKATLAETLADLDAKLRGHDNPGLIDGEVLLIPNLRWNVTHRFGQLEKRFLQNQGHDDTFLDELQQRIEFRLDRSGAELRSESRGIGAKSACGDRSFIFNRPFLIVMKKRGGEEPFFVMWVANAELLCKP